MEEWSVADKIMEFVVNNWVEWLFLGLFSVISVWHGKLMKTITLDKEKNRAVAKGVEALLRDRIIESFNKYEKKGYCPIFAKENVRRMYIPYHKLGGNDVATELVEKLLEMPVGND